MNGECNKCHRIRRILRDYAANTILQSSVDDLIEHLEMLHDRNGNKHRD